MDGGEDRVPLDQRQHVMKLDVGALEAPEIADRLAVLLELRLEPRQIVLGRVLGGVARQARLEEHAR